jgi:TonB family protein
MFSAQRLTPRIILLLSLIPSLIGQAPPGTAYRIGNGVSQPQLIHKIEPEYSEEARNAKWEGVVQLEIVVDENGNPKDLNVRRSLGFGLDEKAIDAVKQWRFKPGLKEGLPVPVIAVVDVSFRLLDKPPLPRPVDAESLAAANDLVSAINPDALMDAVMTQSRLQIRQQIAGWMTQQIPKDVGSSVPQDVRRDFELALFKLYDDRFRAEARPLLARSYAETFTLQELRELSAFFSTPTGKSFFQKTPEVYARNSIAGNSFAVQFFSEQKKAVQDWVDAMKKKYGTP